MPAPLLGLLLLVCPQGCELPLPHAALELRVAGPQWQWCLRVDAAAGWRLCDADVARWLRRQLDKRLSAVGCPCCHGGCSR